MKELKIAVQYPDKDVDEITIDVSERLTYVRAIGLIEALAVLGIRDRYEVLIKDVTDIL